MSEIAENFRAPKNLILFIYDDENDDSTADIDITEEDSTLWHNYPHFVSDNLWYSGEYYDDSTSNLDWQTLLRSPPIRNIPEVPTFVTIEREALSWEFEPLTLKNLVSEFIVFSAEDLYNKTPAPQTDAPTWDEVLKALESFRYLEEGWDGFDAITPNESSLQAAIDIAGKYRNTLRCPRILIDGDGDIVWTWESSLSTIFMTIEGSKLHLLCKNSDGSRFAFDSLPFDRQHIPKEILGFLPRQ